MTSYINQLKDLTPKSAEIESTFIIRELKKKTPLPLKYNEIFELFSLYFVSESEKQNIEQAIIKTEETISQIINIGHLKDSHFEPINLKRAVEMLHELPNPLALNLIYANSIFSWQEEFTQDFAPLMNKLPSLTSLQEREQINNELNNIFNKLLRNNILAFNYKDIINEAHKNRIHDLQESLENGFLFKLSLEDELRKTPYEERKKNIPEDKLVMAEEIKKKIKEIKKGVDAAYELNLRMVNWALIVYAYIKYITAKK